MLSHLSQKNPPYRLPGNKMLFHDWRFLQPGTPKWFTESGERGGRFSVDPVPTMKFDYSYTNTPGLTIRAKKAEKSDPVITPENSPFPFFIHPGSVIYEDGLYRLWLEYWPVEGFGKTKPTNLELLCYGESDDGFHWSFPKQNQLESDIGCADIAVYGALFVPQTGSSGASVFKDPSAPLAERYKMLHQGRAHGDMLKAYLEERPEDVSENAIRGDIGHGLFGAVSPDGLHWTPLEKPLLLQTADSHNICEYDKIRGTYVAYMRDHIMGRRTIGRSESSDFQRLPRPEPVFWPGPDRPHTELWYTNGKNTLPLDSDYGDYHVMFPMRWDVATDRYDFYMAASPDNVVWHIIPGGLVCEPGEAGTWDGECVWPGCGMVSLPGNRMGILYCGMAVPHKYPRHAPLGGLAWATWQKDRLAALEASAEARFQTVPVLASGRELRINARIKTSGYLKVEVLDSEENIVSGRSFADCDPVGGNGLNIPVTWNSKADLGHRDGEALTLRIEMRHTELFAVDFVSS